MWNMRARGHLVERCWDGNTADVGKVKVRKIVCKVISGGRRHMIWKAYLYTRHKWEEALAVHRPVVLRAQGLEDGTAYQLMGLGRRTKRNGKSWRIAAPIIYSSDARLSGSHDGLS